RWTGALGRSSTLNGAAIRCRGCPGLVAATLFATTPDMFKGEDAASFFRVSAAVKLTRFGADCYAYGLLAAGFVDLVLEASLKPYDFCAMVPIVEGAGGVATNWRGDGLGLSSDGRILVAGDRRTHDAALILLGGWKNRTEARDAERVRDNRRRRPSIRLYRRSAGRGNPRNVVVR